MRLRASAIWASGLSAILLGTATTAHDPRLRAQTSSPPPPIRPVIETEPVPHDPDDPALWISSTRPERSLILATDKFAREGGLYAFGLDGRVRQAIQPLDRPNNVDVEYGFRLGRRRVDIAVLTERNQRRLRVFRIPSDGGALVDLAPAGLPVLEGAVGEAGEPMGIALYKRPRDGAVYVIVAPKSGGASDYLWQYRLESPDSGALAVTLVRRFGTFSRTGATPGEVGEIEAVAVDDQSGYVYYTDERFGIRKWHADPDHAHRARELAVLGADGYQGDREGLAVYATGRDRGFLVSSDQVSGGTRLHLYRREASGRGHDQPRVAIIPTISDETDGLDVTSRALPGFPRGLLVMMNSRGRNFLLYRWEEVERVMRQPR